MRIPIGVIGQNGEQAKGEAVLYANENDLVEYGTTVDGNHSTCYILTSPGDVITASFAINSGTTAEFADLVVDGILRSTWSNSRGAKVFRYTFDRGCYKGVPLDKKRTFTKNARMRVISRHTQNDRLTKGAQGTSAVGTISVQIFRKVGVGITASTGLGTPRDIPIAPTTKEGAGTLAGENEDAEPTKPISPLGLADRAPNFIKHSSWYNLNHNINSDGPLPPFEIGFFDGYKHHKVPQDRVTKEWTEDYKIWASFTFKLFSTADLRALGFDVPIYYSPTAPEPETSTASQEPSRLNFLNPSDPTTCAQVDNSIETLFRDEQDEVPKDNTEATTPHAKNQTSNPLIIEEQQSISSILASLARNRRHKLDENSETAAPESESYGEQAVKVESVKSEDCTRIKAREKILALPDVNCPQAHQAFLERSATAELEPEPQTDDFNATFAEKVPIEEHITKSDNPQTSITQGASSPAVSEAPTEVTSPEDMETTRICSFRANAGSQSQNMDLAQAASSSDYLTHSVPYTPEPVFNYSKDSPNTGSNERLMNARAVSRSTPTTPETPEMAAARTRKHWQNRTYMMNRPLPQTPGVQCFSKIPQFGGQMTSTSKAIIPVKKTIATATIAGQKRKADSISGNEDNTSSEPSKTRFVPTLATSDEIERLRTTSTTTEARIAAAERQRIELQRCYQAALELRTAREKIQRLEQEAEIIERENAELELKIAAIYDGGDGI